MTDDLDYLRSEAERLPNGTAAKALRMMQPATVTITISREDAEEIADALSFAISELPPADTSSMDRVFRIVDAALEEKPKKSPLRPEPPRSDPGQDVTKAAPKPFSELGEQ